MDRQALQTRWTDEQARIEKILSALKAGENWAAFLGAFEADGIPHGPLPFVDPQRSGGRDLRGLSVDNVDLSHAHIEGVDLEFAKFFKVKLDWASISSLEQASNLTGAFFVHCTFEGARFQGANCQNVHFGHCDLSDADFAGATLDSATLRSSNLRGANLVGASLRDVNFIHSDLQQVRVSSKTVLGVLPCDATSSFRIRLEDEALDRTFDIFQFANQGEAFEGAAKVYQQLADASDRCGLSEIGDLWRRKDQECLQLASRLRHG